MLPCKNNGTSVYSLPCLVQNKSNEHIVLGLSLFIFKSLSINYSKLVFNFMNVTYSIEFVTPFSMRPRSCIFHLRSAVSEGKSALRRFGNRVLQEAKSVEEFFLWPLHYTK